MDVNQYLGLFAEEVKEHLENLNYNLLLIEKNMDDIDLVNELFRSAHTIKGMSASMGYNKMANLTHGMEDVLHDIRDGKIKMDTKLINLLFIGLDFLENSLSRIIEEGIEEESKIDEILHKLHRVIEEKTKDEDEKIKEETPLTRSLILADDHLYRIERAIEDGFNVYYIGVKIEDTCQLKEVRGFMALKELSDNGQIVYSEPVFDEDNFGNIVLESNNIFTVLISEQASEFIKERIENILEIERVDIEDYREMYNSESFFTMDDSSEKVEDISRVKEDIDINTLAKEVIEECLYEIIQFTNNIDIAIDNLVSFQKDSEESYRLFKGFHAIKGLGDFIDFKGIKKICEKTELILDENMRKEANFNKEQMNIIRASNEVIRKEAKSFDGKEKTNENITAHLRKLDELIGKDRIADDIKLENNDSEDKIIESKIKKKPLEQKKSLLVDSGYIKIPIKRADNLSDLSGELLILQSQLEQLTKEELAIGSSLFNVMKRMDRITREIQNITMSLQRISLKPLFQKLIRIGRDTSQELNKTVEIRIDGEATEIDRNVVDKLLEPMMHLLRNAIHHGIEDEEERLKKGKAKNGKIEIRAESRRDMVILQVSDDGKGIPVNKIREKLLERKLIDQSTAYSDEEIINMIFLPGFSTAENVNNISGRGVGMDAVRTQVSKLGGRVEINSKEGLGTTFTLKIPVTSTAINGTVIEIEGKKYVIPTLAIKQILIPGEDRFIKIKGKSTMIRYRDRVIPIISLDRFLDNNNLSQYDDQIIIVLEYDDKLRALPVNTIVSRREVVVKPLGDDFSHLRFLSGATILGDGKIALILDVENLFNSN